MKKIIILFVFVFCLLFIRIDTNANEGWTKEDYLSEISRLEDEINNIKEEIENLKIDIEEKNQQIEDVKQQYDDLITDEELLDWFNYLDKYATRANVSVICERGIYDNYISGIVIKKTVSTYYVLTLLAPLFGNISYYIEDAFGYQYQASIYNGSVEYGLAVLKFTSPYDDANIIAVDIADDSLNKDDYLCHIYTTNNTLKNHMAFTNVLDVNNNTYKSAIDFENKSYGFMGIGYDRKLHSICYNDEESNTILSYNETYINNFLNSVFQ